MSKDTYPFATTKSTPLYPPKELREMRQKILADMRKTMEENDESLDSFKQAELDRHLIAMDLEEKALDTIDKLEEHLKLID